MQSFKEIRTSNNNILLVDQANHFYIMGSNMAGKCNKSDAIPFLMEPIPLHIELEEDECIKTFKAYKKNICIHTSNNDLVIVASRNQFPYDPLNISTTAKNKSHIDPDDDYIECKSSDLIDKPYMDAKVGCQFKKSNFIILHDVTWIVYGDEVIMYGVKNIGAMDSIQLLVLNQNLKMPQNTRHPHLVLRPIILGPEIDSLSYELCLPQEFNEIHHNHKFLHLVLGNLHHVIVPTLSVKGIITWIYFETDLKLDITQMYWSDYEFTLFVVHEQSECIYKYEFVNHTLQPFISTKNTRYTFATRGYGNELCLIDSDGIYVTSDLTKIADFHNECMYSVVDTQLISRTPKYPTSINPTNHVLFIAYYYPEKSYHQPHKIIDNMILFNTYHIQYFGFTDKNTFVYVDKGNFHFLTIGEIYIHYLPREMQSLRIIKNIVFGPITLIDAITGIHITYHNNFASIYKISSPRKSRINDDSKLPLPLLKRKSFRSVSFTNTKSLEIRTTQPILPQLMNTIGYFQAYTGLSVTYHASSSTSAGGGGVNRTFFDSVLNEFAGKYLIRHNHLLSFNVQAILGCDPQTLESFGKMIVLIFANSEQRLSIHFPLSLLSIIRRRPPTKYALEYFAHLEDPEAYLALKNMEYKLPALIAAGYDSYYDGLKTLCKFDLDLPVLHEQIHHIANSFLRHTKNDSISKLNLPTLDYCFSGEFKIDVERFIRQVNIDNGFKPYQERIFSIIRGLSQEKLRDLLFNWTGSGILRDTSYSIHAISSTATDILLKFSTCVGILYLHPKALDTQHQACLIHLLTDRTPHMRG